MFVLPLDIQANEGEEPPPLEAAFGELFTVLAPFAGERDPVTLTETLWYALHGIAILADSVPCYARITASSVSTCRWTI
jgi:hypothetical protein